jgi:regulator of protease activity HflC (stomatin/prohibitin superfamily)
MFGAKRVEYTQKVATELQRRFGEKFVKFESLNLRGWHLPENLQQALDAKITAQQAAEQQQFALNQAKIKAEQDKVTAEGQANAVRAQAQGEADATKIRAEGDAQATLTRAKAQAEANGQLSKSLTPDLISYQQLQRWDGKLPIFSGQQSPPPVGATENISGTATR